MIPGEAAEAAEAVCPPLADCIEFPDLLSVDGVARVLGARPVVGALLLYVAAMLLLTQGF